MTVWGTRLVQRIVTSYPCVVLVSRSDLLPQPYGSILMVLEIPKRGVAATRVRMPIRILSSGGGVHVQNRVDLVFRAQINNPIHVFETRLFQHSRVHVVFEMAVVEWYAEAIHAFRGKEFGILVGEEVLEPFVKEVLVLFFAENFEHRATMLELMPGISSDEILHALQEVSSQNV